jgi:hypothetical protein
MFLPMFPTGPPFGLGEFVCTALLSMVFLSPDIGEHNDSLILSLTPKEVSVFIVDSDRDNSPAFPHLLL